MYLSCWTENKSSLIFYPSREFWSGRIFVRRTKYYGKNGPGGPFLLGGIGPTLGNLVRASKHSLPLSDDYRERDIFQRCHPKKYRIICVTFCRGVSCSQWSNSVVKRRIRSGRSSVRTNRYPETEKKTRSA